MAELFSIIRDPQDGDEVQYLGIYALRWLFECGVKPTVAFVESDVDVEALVAQNEALKNLLMACDDQAYSNGVTSEVMTAMEEARAIIAAAEKEEG